MVDMKRLSVVNPVAGHMECDVVEAALHQCFAGENEVHITQNDAETREVVRRALAEGCEQIIIAGGDGTISLVADEVAQTAVPIGIIPVGTANLLARELEIPLDVQQACQLIMNPEAVRYVDGMRANGRIYISHISMGVYSQFIEHTSPELKQQLGRAAYLYAAIKEIQSYPTWRFYLTVDDRSYVEDASMVIVANIGAVGVPPLRWGPNITPDGGKLTVCVVKADSAADYFDLIWKEMRGTPEVNEQITYLTAVDSIALAVDDPELSVRADGEIVGQQRIEIQVVPNAVKVIVPK